MEGIANGWMWAGFALFVVVAITVDLLALERKGSHSVGVREALGWSVLWVSLALIPRISSIPSRLTRCCFGRVPLSH